MGGSCSKKPKKRKVVSESTSEDSESSSSDSSKSSSSSRSSDKKSSKPSSVGKKKQVKQTKGAGGTSRSKATSAKAVPGKASSYRQTTKYGDIKLKVNTPRAKNKVPESPPNPKSSVSTSAKQQPTSTMNSTQGSISSNYYIPANGLADPYQALLLLPKEANGTHPGVPFQQQPNGNYDYAHQQYYYEQNAQGTPVSVPETVPLTIDQMKQWEQQQQQQYSAAATATTMYQKEQFVRPPPPPPPSQELQQTKWQQITYPVQPPMMPPTGAPQGFYARKEMIKCAAAQPVPFPPKVAEQGQARVCLVDPHQGCKQPIYVPLPKAGAYYAQINDPYLQGKVINYYEQRMKQQYKMQPQQPGPPPAKLQLWQSPVTTQMTTEYAMLKQGGPVQPAPVPAYPPLQFGQTVQVAPQPNWQQQKYYAYQQQQVPAPMTASSPPNASPFEPYVYAPVNYSPEFQHTMQQETFVRSPIPGGTEQQEQSPVTRVSTDEHLDLLRRDICELKQIIQAQDTKEVMAKMDKCLEMFKSVNKVYHELMRDETLRRQIGRNDTAIGQNMSRIKTVYDDISSEMSALSKGTKKLVKDVKRSPGSVANREQIGRTVKPEELTRKMETITELINTLKNSYSPEIMKVLMDKEKDRQ